MKIKRHYYFEDPYSEEYNPVEYSEDEFYKKIKENSKYAHYFHIKDEELGLPKEELKSRDMDYITGGSKGFGTSLLGSFRGGTKGHSEGVERARKAIESGKSDEDVIKESKKGALIGASKIVVPGLLAHALIDQGLKHKIELLRDTKIGKLGRGGNAVLAGANATIGLLSAYKGAKQSAEASVEKRKKVEDIRNKHGYKRDIYYLLKDNE